MKHGKRYLLMFNALVMFACLQLVMHLAAGVDVESASPVFVFNIILGIYASASMFTWSLVYLIYKWKEL